MLSYHLELVRMRAELASRMAAKCTFSVAPLSTSAGATVMLVVYTDFLL